MAMPILVRWEKRFETGDEAIDFDHQLLFALVNEVHCSVLEGCSRERLRSMAVDFVRYAREHFRAEESLMEVCGYDGLAEHVQAHQDLCTTIRELAIASDLQGTRLCAFAYDWLIGHILQLDLPMMRHVQHARERLSDRHSHCDERATPDRRRDVQRSA